MAEKVIMPKAGMDMQEGTVIKWFKKEGEQVEEGEPLLEIMTDKVNMEVEAGTSGTLLKIIKGEGEVVPVTQLIGYIGNPGEQVEVPEIEDRKSETIEKETAGSVAGFSSTQRVGGDSFDVVVIGGGPAGYVAAIKAAQLGGRVALVEKDNVGGTCLNRGCIPTKAYLRNAETIEIIRNAAKRGIMLDSDSFKVDMEKVVDVKNGIVKSLTSGIAEILRSYDIKTYKGIGRITRDKKVSIDDRELIETSKIILAGGSKPSKLNIPGMDSKLVLTSDEILDLKEVPAHIAIIGGGVIGIEMGMVFRAYGSRVTIVEMADRIVPFMDAEISAGLSMVLEEKGIKVLVSTKLERLEENGGKILLYTDRETIEADKALLSIGRVADLDATGEIALEMEKGRIKVNDKMETSVDGIYAPGDVNGLRMLAHAAFKMGEVAAANAMGHSEKVRLDYVPSCVYTMPEVGSIGLTEAEARERHEVSIGRFSFGSNGRAFASGENQGFVKVITEKKYGELLGVHIIGPAAAEIINEAAVLMSMEITANEVPGIIHSHPAFSEALMEAVADSINQCIHSPRKNVK